jgi:large conductance mechanosensitive channel
MDSRITGGGLPRYAGEGRVGRWDNLCERTAFRFSFIQNKTLNIGPPHASVLEVSVWYFDLEWPESMRKRFMKKCRSLYFEMRFKRPSFSRKRRGGSTRILRVSHTVIISELNLDFLGRDNVLEVALGLIIGGAFTGVVTSLVSDIILPPISLVTDSSKNLVNYFIVLRPGETPDAIYNTVQQAAEDGQDSLIWMLIVQERYSWLGVTLLRRYIRNSDISNEKSLDFVILGLVLYFAIKCRIIPRRLADLMTVIALLGEDGIVKKTTSCEHCRKDISL